MELIYIGFSVFVLVILVISLIEDLIFGDRGRKNQITEHFNYLKGNESGKTNKVKPLMLTNKDEVNKKYIIYTVAIFVAIFFITLMAFKSTFMSFMLSLMSFFYPKAMKKNEKKNKENLINTQLMDALSSITNSLKAGLSINSALIKCAEDLERMYSHVKVKPMLDEFKKVKNDLSMGTSVEDVLLDFSSRLKTEEVEDLVNSIIIVRQKGGNLVEVMVNVNTTLRDKILIKKEIEVLTSSKKFEAKIVSIIPVLIVLSLSIFSPDYMKPLYSSALGKILIILGFLLLVANYFIGRKIVDIKI